MALIDEFLSLPKFTKPILGAAVSDAVATTGAAAPAIVKHAEITGSMNIGDDNSSAALDALFSLAEQANAGEGVDLCVTIKAYDGLFDAFAWGNVELTSISGVRSFIYGILGRVLNSNRIIGFEPVGGDPGTVTPVMGPLNVAWIVFDVRDYLISDGTERTPEEQYEWLRSIGVKLDVVGAVAKAAFPNAGIIFWRNGERIFKQGDTPLANYIAYTDARMVEWFSLHDRARTLERLRISKQATHVQAPGADMWGAAVSIGGGRDRTENFTFNYTEGRSPWYHLGMYFGFDDYLQYLYEWPGPFDQRIGTDPYMTAMISLSNGFHGIA